MHMGEWVTASMRICACNPVGHGQFSVLPIFTVVDAFGGGSSHINNVSITSRSTRETWTWEKEGKQEGKSDKRVTESEERHKGALHVHNPSSK
jgi:hypothetical protein